MFQDPDVFPLRWVTLSPHQKNGTVHGCCRDTAIHDHGNGAVMAVAKGNLGEKGLGCPTHGAKPRNGMDEAGQRKCVRENEVPVLKVFQPVGGVFCPNNKVGLIRATCPNKQGDEKRFTNPIQTWVQECTRTHDSHVQLLQGEHIVGLSVIRPENGSDRPSKAL
jgi:hypothetical protein